MLDSITGEIVRKDAGAVVLRTGGVGFCLMVPRRTVEGLPDEGEATLHAHLSVREDTVKLFGFESVFERELFRKLNSVAGVGGATALLLLSDFTPEEIVEGIMTDNSARFLKVKGVGAKTAKRIVLELKGKVEEMGYAPTSGSAAADGTAASAGEDLLSALVALGFPRSKAKDVSVRVLADNPDEEDLEKLLRTALALINV
jgi:Holliday junction DNA helicase RuvA